YFGALKLRLNGGRSGDVGKSNLVGQHRLEIGRASSEKDELVVQTVFFKQARVVRDPKGNVVAGDSRISDAYRLRVTGPRNKNGPDNGREQQREQFLHRALLPGRARYPRERGK